jgi:hypothetical protein
MFDAGTLVKQELFNRVADIFREWSENQAAIEDAQRLIQRHQARQAELVSSHGECVIAGKVFGFDLEAEYREWVQGGAPGADSDNFEARPTPAPVVSARRPVREIILEAAERAHPAPVRAADLRRLVAEQGLAVHEKTVGMTLYRLSQTGQMFRRAGTIDWYFKPKAEVEKSTAPEDELEAETTTYQEDPLDDLF